MRLWKLVGTELEVPLWSEGESDRRDERVSVMGLTEYSTSEQQGENQVLKGVWGESNLDGRWNRVRNREQHDRRVQLHEARREKHGPNPSV